MAIAFVQSTSGINANGSTQNIVATAFASANTAGNAIIVVVAYDGAATNISGVTDTKGNTYTKAILSGGNTNVSIWYALNIGAQTSNVVTVGGAFNDGVVIAQEFSGLATTGALDKTASATGSNGGTLTLGTTAATTTASQLVIGALEFDYFTGDTLSVGSGYSNFVTAHSNFASGAMESKIIAATGTQTATVVASDTQFYSWSGAIATFSATSIGGAATPSNQFFSMF